jgi:hypothetical protein
MDANLKHRNIGKGETMAHIILTTPIEACRSTGADKVHVRDYYLLPACLNLPYQYLSTYDHAYVRCLKSLR